MLHERSNPAVTSQDVVVLALVLVLVALDVVTPVLFPAPSPQILLEEACDLVDAERRAS